MPRFYLRLRCLAMLEDAAVAFDILMLMPLPSRYAMSAAYKMFDACLLRHARMRLYAYAAQLLIICASSKREALLC